MLSGGNENVGIEVLPGREELWVLGFTATGSDGSLNAGQFADVDQRWRGLYWTADPDERWRLSYRVVADGRSDVPFSVVVFADKGRLRCVLEG
jgi:hypothetical protein